MPEPTELFKVIRTAIDQADHANPASFDTMASHIEFAVNNYFSDEGNEGEKAQRLNVAIDELLDAESKGAISLKTMRAIIAKAQG